MELAALYWEGQGDWERAAVTYNAALDQDLDSVEAFSRLESILGEQKRWDLLEENYRRMIERLEAKCACSEAQEHELKQTIEHLKAQARSLGLEERWHEVAQMYADANQMFGDIVKVTPSSKVVGDMALMMVSQGLTRADVEDPSKDVAFPDSVVDMMRGNLGQPPGGFPAGIVAKALKGDAPNTDRPGAHLAPVDLEEVRAQVSADLDGFEVDDEVLIITMGHNEENSIANLTGQNVTRRITGVSGNNLSLDLPLLNDYSVAYSGNFEGVFNTESNDT